MNPILESRGVAYDYSKGITALSGVDFELQSGENVALIGANGAGKSTLLQILVGILEPSDGAFFFEGQKVTKPDLPFLREKIGFVFQNAEHQLFCNTAYEDVVFGPLNAGLSLSEADTRATEAFRALGAEHLAKRAPYHLSAGEKRAVAIASVLSMRPEILLMDEPTSDLDPRARRELTTLLNRLPQAKIIATHDLGLAKNATTRVMILHGGKIATTGPSGHILSDERLLESLGL